MIQEKKLVYNKALVELNEIIKHMDADLQNKIPEELKEEFIRKADKEYVFYYDEDMPLEEQDIMPETQGLLSVIYSNYLCQEEEKEKWKAYDKFYKQKLEEKKQNTSNVKEIFPRKAEHMIKEPSNVKEATISKEIVVIKKKNIFLKILEKIKLWFSKK